MNRPKTNLGVTIGKLRLANPIICASGTFGFGEELRGFVDFGSVGAIATKTITLEPRAGNPPPRIFETECGVINSVGLENPGVDKFISEKLKAMREIDTKFIISVGGGSIFEYSKIVQRLDETKDVDAIEVNLSCPNIKNKKIVSQDKKETYKVVKALRKVTSKTLIAKITPEVSDIVSVAVAAQDAGADALALVNTFFAMAINIETAKPYIGNIYGGYSGPAIKPMSLYRVWRVASVVKIPVIGGGGITDADAAIEFLLAGATAVSLGTVNLVYPNKAKEVLAGIIEYMRRKNIKDINKLRGSMNV
ncbi:MAG: dihydroorotate dehydrogenase [Candidatus Omnitrophica bacterium]|nr:dihydroorotate dehydrogenase [Candidatus Omnitrophota bacterium]